MKERGERKRVKTKRNHRKPHLTCSSLSQKHIERAFVVVVVALHILSVGV